LRLGHGLHVLGTYITVGSMHDNFVSLSLL
jgi:hypothetical protein